MEPEGYSQEDIQDAIAEVASKLTFLCDELIELSEQRIADPRDTINKAFMLRVLATHLDAISKVQMQQLLDKVFSAADGNLNWDEIMESLRKQDETD